MQISKSILISFSITLFATSVFAQQGPTHSFSVDSSASNFTFTPDSQKIVFNEFSVAKVYDLNTQEITLVFDKHSLTISDIDISPDGQWVATGGLASKAFVWNINTGEVKCDMTMPLTPDDRDYRPVDGIKGVDFSDDGQFLLTGTTRAGTWLWDIDKCIPIFKTGHPVSSSREDLQLFPDSSKALINSIVISIPEGEILFQGINGIATVINNKLIRYTGTRRNPDRLIVKEADVQTQQTRELYSRIIDDDTVIENLTISPDGNFVLLGNFSDTFTPKVGHSSIISVQTGENVKQFDGSLSTKINSLVFGRSMKHFAAIHEDQVQIFDIDDLTSQISDAPVMDNQ